MITKIEILKWLIAFCITFGTMAVIGQTPQTYVWTNQFPGHLAGAGDMNQATNYDPNGVPNPMTGPDANGLYGDLCVFDGRTTGPLSVTESGGTLGSGANDSHYAGVRIQLTLNQTNSVTIFSVLPVSAGLRISWFSVDPGAGALILGDHSTNIFDILVGAQNGQVVGFTNNSTTPSFINESVRWRMGGAGFHPHIFAGTGDWIVRNHMRSANSSAVGVQIEGPGTVTWYGTNCGLRSVNWFDNLGSPLRINGGTLILRSSDLVSTDAGTVAIIHNGTLLKFDAQPTPGLITDPATIPGVISGSGPIQINAGIFTFAGASTFAGNINLTGGELIAGSVETVGVSGPLGVGGTISFGGGTLGFSTNNAFDYSPRFSTAAGQAISIDTAGQSVTFATGLGSSGGTLAKIGGGTLTLSGASSYDDITTVNAGKLMFRGPKTGAGDIIVAGGAALGVTATGTQITPGTLTLGTNTGCTLEFDNVSSTTAAPIVANTLSSAGTVTINVNSGSGAMANYPLLAWSNGPAPAVSLGTLNGFVAGNLSISDQTVWLNVTTGAPTLNCTNTGNGLQFSWTGSFKLQAQTNSVSAGLGGNWVDYPGGDTSPATVPISATSGTVFFRLISTP